MNREVKSKLLEKVVVGDKAYEIVFIDIPDYAYIKRIDERITYPEVAGMGHKVSNVLWMEEDEDLYYSVTPHNENNSSGLGVNKKIDDVTDDEFGCCQNIINNFYPLITNGMFPEEAKKVFDEFMKKMNAISHERDLNKK